MSLPVFSSDAINDRIFQLIYSRSLVYNTCWEDPAVDREALEIGPRDSIVVITSAGCNVLDYVLTGPASVHAVDMNPRQNALLALKIAGLRGLDFDDFFQVFGNGSHPHFAGIYHEVLRDYLDGYARQYWDQRLDWFSPTRHGGLYFRGLSGSVARMFHLYLQARPSLRRAIERLLSASSLDEQREVYESAVHPCLWSRGMNWIISRQMMMNMLGVPHPQRREVEAQHEAGVSGFIRECIEYVFCQLPLSANYFWRLYLQESYTPDCCPEYLKRENYLRLRNGLLDRIHLHTDSVTGFLLRSDARFSRFVLLDHMDWMSTALPVALAEEWQAILQHATEDARILFRSAHRQPAYLHNLVLPDGNGGQISLMERLRFHPDWAAALTRKDRVHTYAGFHIADVII